jgi:hypothetical protein
MLTDAEFADMRRLTPEDMAAIGPEAEEFSLFTWDLAAAVNRDGSPAFPELVETNSAGMVRSKPAYRVLRHSATSLRKAQEEQSRIEASQKEAERQAKLAEYIERGYAFDERALTDPHGKD